VGDGFGIAPDWVAEQLDFSPARMQEVSRGLAALGLVEVFGYEADEFLRGMRPSLKPGPVLTDIRLTESGWNHLRR
jgi:hypothetical protein